MCEKEDLRRRKCRIRTNSKWSSTNRHVAVMAFVRKSAPNEIVPDGMEALAKEGADACPQSALKLVAA